MPPSRPRLPPALVRRLLLDASGYFQNTFLPNADGHFLSSLREARERVEAGGCPIPAVETTVRYAWARSMLQGVVCEPKTFALTATDRIDRVLTHRVWGLVVFAVVMLMVFQSVFVWARPLMDVIGAGFNGLSGSVEARMPEGALRSLLAVGVIGGVGGVVQFLPQILILFTFIALLEDCGYMARAAFLMDRVMVRSGLSGRSFIPMLSSFACAVPGIMAARVIENERDRLTTILVAPLLTCSARLPVYALLIAAFVPQTTYLGGMVGLQGLTLASLYVLGIVAAVSVALVLKRTILRGATPPFVMEMPSYKWPSPRTVAMRVMERAWIFLRTAGSLILAISIVVWAAAYYPHDPRVVRAGTAAEGEAGRPRSRSSLGSRPQRAEMEEQLTELDNQIAAKYQQHSLLGLMGKTHRAGRPPLGLGLADRLCGDRLVSGAGSRRGHAGRRLRAGQEDRHEIGRGPRGIGRAAAAGRLGRHRSSGVHVARGAFADGVFRPAAAMRGDAGGDPAGDEQLAVAGLCVQLYDGPGIYWRVGNVSGGDMARVVASILGSSS